MSAHPDGRGEASTYRWSGGRDKYESSVVLNETFAYACRSSKRLSKLECSCRNELPHAAFSWEGADSQWEKVYYTLPKCSSHQDASSDMQHDLLRWLCDLDLRWPGVRFTNWPFEVKKHTSRSGLTRGAQWYPYNSPFLCSSEVNDKNIFLPKHVILTFDDLWFTHYWSDRQSEDADW